MEDPTENLWDLAHRKYTHTTTEQIKSQTTITIYNVSASVFGLWILWTTPEFGVSPTLLIISCFS